LQSKKVVNDPSDLPPAVDDEEGASVEEFLDGVIVTPKIVLDVASQVAGNVSYILLCCLG
jgi:hypothetical protein